MSADEVAALAVVVGAALACPVAFCADRMRTAYALAGLAVLGWGYQVWTVAHQLYEAGAAR